MSDISGIRHTPPVSWLKDNRLHPADRQKDNPSGGRKDEDKEQRRDSDDDNHIDEYA